LWDVREEVEEEEAGAVKVGGGKGRGGGGRGGGEGGVKLLPHVKKYDQVTQRRYTTGLCAEEAAVLRPLLDKASAVQQHNVLLQPPPAAERHK
jgi:hypothetical protein